MKYFSVLLFSLFLTLQTINLYSQKENPNIVTEKNLYQTTIEAYKSFNEQTVKYISIALSIVSILSAILITLFVYLFRKNLSEMKSELQNDAKRINDVYAKTFELLNKQADTNLNIFLSREKDLTLKISEINSLYNKVNDVFNKISKEDKVREPVAEKLMEDEFSTRQKEATTIKEEFNELKNELEYEDGK